MGQIKGNPVFWVMPQSHAQKLVGGRIEISPRSGGPGLSGSVKGRKHQGFIRTYWREREERRVEGRILSELIESGS